MRYRTGGSLVASHVMRLGTVLPVVVLFASLVACGSRLAPEDVVPAMGGGGGNASGGASDTTSPQAASCDGFQNGPGIDDKQITIANASDVGGPQPDRFASAQQAVQAYVAYFNATTDVCGRKLNLLSLDSRGDTGGDQAAATQACQRAFAMVGSMSDADAGGVRTVTDCGIPDLRAASMNPERSIAPVVFSARSSRIGQIPTAVPDYFVRNNPDAIKQASLIYVNAGVAASATAQGWIVGSTNRGYRWVYGQAVDVSEFNYAPYVLQMKQLGVRLVQFLGPHQHAVRLAQAMRQQGFTPDVFLLGPAAYHPDFVASGAAAVDGAMVYLDTALLEDADRTPELQLYVKWLGQAAPGAKPSYEGMFAWSAARLFTDQAIKLGGKLSRQSLLAALAGVTKWDGHGLSAPQHVGARNTAPCITMVKLEGGKWVRKTEDRFVCGELVGAGVSG